MVAKEEPMSRFRVYVALSIDGYIADENGIVELKYEPRK